ncbi:helix-turn-helix transcriptional regulator [Kitasatospora purpeofusca]|uniref:helix-turn-helix transcriptional regulator n=1 Tax=Kitasatospora purpeofusca TaxID=67352 RepID=UPI00364F1AD7
MHCTRTGLPTCSIADTCRKYAADIRSWSRDRGLVSADLPSWVPLERRLVGRRIRAIREARGYSQESLAHEAGVHRHTVYRAELGTHGIGIDGLLLIAHTLGVPPTRFFTDE